MRLSVGWIAWGWFFASSLLVASATVAGDWTKWSKEPPDWAEANVTSEVATLSRDRWGYLIDPEQRHSFALETTLRIVEPAKLLQFFGQSWSVWPDKTYADGGFDAGVLFRGGKTPDGLPSGYRVAVSHRYQCLALVKFPEGGYLRVVPVAVKLNEPHKLTVRVAANRFIASWDGETKIEFTDVILPLDEGSLGVGVSSKAKVAFDSVTVQALARQPNSEKSSQPHQPRFAIRRWLGDRAWVFDGDEPILLLPAPESSYINNVKLRPGYKPQLSWNSHWDTQNQGAYKEAENKTVDVQTSGGGKELVATWRGEHVGKRFGTQTKLTIGYDASREVYAYATDSTLEVFPGEPFLFRYGYDFEHHTPLDPFRWQYLIARERGGELYHRPVYPIDPGPQNDLEPYHGLRVWQGRHADTQLVSPAVEYEIDPEANRDPKDLSQPAKRPLHTAVCAAFYDTGVAFGQELAPPGTKIRVRYTYTGYPLAETQSLFAKSKVYESLMLDPERHYIFADEWPRLTFRQAVPLSETWIYGRTPFKTGHNVRPTYEYVPNCGAGSGHAMKLGPASFAKANWPMPESLASGRYYLTALVKSANAHGPGGFIELEATNAKSKQTLAQLRHYVGNGSFEWQHVGFPLELNDSATNVSLAFGNSGTGAMLVTDVELHPLKPGEAIPAGVSSQPRSTPPEFPAAPAGALVDFRMQEGGGDMVLNYARAADRDVPRFDAHLELANVDWVVDSGRPALRFGEADRNNHRRDLNLSRYSWPDKERHAPPPPCAISGYHGGGRVLPGLTLAAWIKPAKSMGVSTHLGKGDIIGYGARRFILGLHGQTAPYKLAARLNVNDVCESDATLEADRWYHVALTATPEAGQWRARLFVDGQQVGEMLTKKAPAGDVISDSLVLGAELLYLHTSYYRGLIGHTLVFDRALTSAELNTLAALK